MYSKYDKSALDESSPNRLRELFRQYSKQKGLSADEWNRMAESHGQDDVIPDVPEKMAEPHKQHEDRKQVGEVIEQTVETYAETGTVPKKKKRHPFRKLIFSLFLLAVGGSGGYFVGVREYFDVPSFLVGRYSLHKAIVKNDFDKIDAYSGESCHPFRAKVAT